LRYLVLIIVVEIKLLKGLALEMYGLPVTHNRRGVVQKCMVSPRRVKINLEKYWYISFVFLNKFSVYCLIYLDQISKLFIFR